MDKFNEEMIGTKVRETIDNALTNAVIKWCEFGKRTGLMDKYNKILEKDEELKEEHPALWTVKKVATGAATGVIGSTIHSKD